MEIKNLSLSFGVQEVFNNINLRIDENEKVGIIGNNGAGKTTFFKVILGKLEPDEGKILLPNGARVAALPQVISDEVPDMSISVYDFISSARPIDKLNTELEECYKRLGSLNDDKDLNEEYHKIERIQNKLDYWDQYSAETILLKILDGMDISGDMLKQHLNELSGGQKSKVAFARLLYSKPEIILLDEPTNHLDKKTKDFVVSYLKGYKGSVFVISHDISFLNAITTKTLYLDKNTKSMELYNGNYDSFIKLHTEREKTLKRQAEIQEKEIEKLQAIVDKYASASGKIKKMAQDREKKLEKLLDNKIEVPKETKKAKVQMNANRESSNMPLKVEHLSFRYDKNNEHNIIDDLSFELFKGEKFLIVGENGIGKSTLLKLIVGQLTPDSGEILIPNKTDIGYYAQEHELLDNEKTIVDNFKDIDISQRNLRSVLGRFLFFGDDVYKKVGVLSPGERSRVALAKLSLKGANLLILDEPTNHLDPDTQMIIADVFKDFNGTMLIVSHNPEFVDNLGVERTLLLPSGKISYYDKRVVEHFHNVNKK